MPNRPVSVTVLAILSFIWAAFVVVGSALGVLAYFVPIGPRNPALEALKHEAPYIFSVFGFGVIHLLCTVVLCAGALGSFSLKPWARGAMLTWAIAEILYGLAYSIFSMTYLVPRIMNATAVATPMPAPAFRQIMLVSGIVGGFLGFLFVIALPTCVLIFYNRPKVRDAFRGVFPPTHAFPPTLR